MRKIIGVFNNKYVIYFYIALIYFYLAILVLTFFANDSSITIIWIPAGFGISVLIFGGIKYWPSILVGSLASGLANEISYSVSLGIAIGNTFESLLAFWLLNRLGFSSLLDNVKDYFKIIQVGMVSSCVSALIGVASLILGGYIAFDQRVSSFLHWWAGDTFGLILITPLILVAYQLPKLFLKNKILLRTRFVELLFCFVLSFLSGQAVFIDWWPPSVIQYLKAYYMLIFIVWSAVRFGRIGISALVALISIQILFSVVIGTGYFGNDLVDSGLINVWIYLLIISIVGFTLAIVIEKQISIEKALRDNEEFLSESQKIGNIGSWFWNFKHNQLLWSKETYNIFGVDSEKFKLNLENVLNCIHPEDRILMKNWINKCVAGRSPKNLDFRVVCKDGGIRDIQARGKLKYSESLGFDIAIGTYQDITEVKKTEAARRDQDTRNSILSQIAPVGIYHTDVNGRCIYLNDRGKEISGLTEETYRGEGWVNAIHPEDRNSVFQTWNTYISNNKMFRMEYRFLRPDQSVRWVYGQALPLKDDAGFICGYVGTFTDITERKIAENNLREAKEAAEKAAKVKTEFLANMSHEIRTPMNIISGMAQVLSESSISKEQRRYVSMFEKASNNLLSIINDLLDISKIEAGGLVIEKSQINIKNLIAEIIEICEPKAQSKDLKLTFNIHPNIPEFIIGDEVRIKQILMNLVGNAIKFTHCGTVSVAAERLLDTSKKGTILFSVTDTGIGISEVQEQFLFKPFSQADSRITKKYGGTGLGLVICKKLVEQMGGEIWFVSKSEIGTTFYFTLDCESRNKDEAIPNYATEENLLKIDKLSEKNSPRTRSLLLVDDSEENRTLLKVFLKDTKCKITEAENGEIAVRLAKNEKFDIILMDMQMPILDGYSATQQIREWEKVKNLPRTPIIALSAYALIEEQQKSISVGCDLHMTKPIKKTALIQLIDNFVT